MTAPGGGADPAYLLDADGPAAPPRDNGELVFAAPWESQAFGVAMALHRAGAFEWEDFRRRLIAEIARWESGGGAPGAAAGGGTDSAAGGGAGSAAGGGAEWSYYRCWLRALEGLASARGLVSAEELRARVDVLAAAPPGHDH